VIALARDADRQWMAKAARIGLDPELFFPTAGLPSPLAVNTCAHCPVRRRCADYAEANHEQHGIWAGMSTDRRNRRSRQRLEAAA